MNKFKKIIKIIIFIIVLCFVVFGIPIIIIECYKVDSGYITTWDASAMLGYYGSILGTSITVITLVATISFTKKQIQRESYLKTENEKWNKLKTIFLDILTNINPIVVLKDVMDNGFINPTKTINILHRYQMNCKSSTDLLNAHLNMNDYPKVKHLIDKIIKMAEEFVNISAGEIEQYSNYHILQHKDSAFQMIEIEKNRPGSFSSEYLATNKEVIEKLKTINGDEINSKLQFLNSEFIRVYGSEYRNLLKEIGSTFEILEVETMKEADGLLNFNVKNKSKFSNNKNKEK